METWRYVLGEAKQTRDFELIMTTDFREINFPEGTSSTTAPWSPSAKGYDLIWSYPEIRGLQAIGMDMPSVVNPGPIAARITFFAPVSLLFYFTVLFLISIVRGMGLHPMNFFFLGAGCFAFQLLFAYLVDVIDVFVAFGIAALVSMILVSGYVWLVAGPRVGWPAAIAQFGYMILFSASFFIEGLTGLIITCGAIVTLAILMIATAKVNWVLVFPSKRRGPPPLSVPA
jgi:inner membrane protein involved in colicin E2 resistance